MKNKAIIFFTFLTIILLAVVFVNSYAEAVFKKDNSQEKRRVQECQQNCNRNEECVMYQENCNQNNNNCLVYEENCKQNEECPVYKEECTINSQNNCGMNRTYKKECNRKSCNNQFCENYKNNHHRRNCNK